MKKGKLLALLLGAVSLLSFFGCQNPSNPSKPNVPDSTKKNVDFRNKNAAGEIYSGRFAFRDAEDELLEQAVVEISKNQNNFTDEEIENLITFKDSAAGMKVIVTVPEKVKSAKLDYFNMTYIEKSTDWWSTGLELDYDIRNENDKVKTQFEFEYPLVLPGVETKFAFDFLFSNGYGLQFFKTVTPKHGKGRVDDLPEDFYDHEKYAEFKDGVIKLKSVLPPEATKVWKKQSVVCEKGNDTWWGDGYKQLGNSDVDIEFGHKNDLYVGDLPAVDFDGSDLNLSDVPYCHVGLEYFYSIKNFDGLIFKTPTIETSMMSSDFFKTPVEERSVSNTVVDGNKITFSGDGYFDGFYEGDIKVTYNGESFIPALFVKGIKVYIYAVEDGKYIKKDVKLISEFLKDGGSFANIEGEKVYVKMKTDSSEANLDKSDLTEITVSENIDLPVKTGNMKTITIEDVEETVVIAKNYPWVDGVQDTSGEIINYQIALDITDLYGSELPKKGDMAHLVWNGVSDIDIAKLCVHIVDNSEAIGWWYLLCDRNSGSEILKENIKAGEPFSIEYDLLYLDDSVENVTLVIYVEKDDASDVPTISTVSK